MASTELKPIILYDIPCVIPGRPWSPNTMKTRYCLGYKQLPFTTVWVEFPDISGLLQSKGVTNPPYTLPAIEDPNTGAFIVDSVTIATYLDETYPETPKVLTPAAHAILETVGDAFSFGSGRSAGTAPNTSASASTGGTRPDFAPRLVFVILSAERLNPVSKTYYHQTRAARVGEQWTTLVEACSTSPEFRAERVRQGIEVIRDVWRKVTALCVHQSESGQGTSGGPLLLGEEPCFVDFIVAGRVKYVLDGLVPSEVETLKSLGGGRLGRLVEDLEKYLSTEDAAAGQCAVGKQVVPH